MKPISNIDYRNTLAIYIGMIALATVFTYLIWYLEPSKLIGFSKMLFIVLAGPIYYLLSPDLMLSTFENINVYKLSTFLVALIVLPSQVYLTNKSVKSPLVKYKFLLVLAMVGWLVVGFVSMSVIWMFNIG